MNNIQPIKIILLLLLLTGDGNNRSMLSNTFKLELFLDKLHHTVNTLEKVNSLSKFTPQSDSLPAPKENSPELDRLMETFGPMLNMIMNQK